MTKKEQKKTRQKFDRKSLGLGILAFLALLVVIVTIIVLNNQEEVIPEFKTNDMQIVMTMDEDMASYEESDFEPEITHIVYLHDGDKITNVKAYYEYRTEEEAKEAFNKLSMDYYSGKKLAGKYIVLQAKKDKFSGLTVEEVEKQYSLMKAAGALVEE